MKDETHFPDFGIVCSEQVQHMTIKNRNTMQKTGKEDLRKKKVLRDRRKRNIYCMKEHQNLKHKIKRGTEGKREILRSEK